MSMQPMNAERYEFDAADRIRRAMRVADVGVTELARALDVNRNTVGNWINGHTVPRRRDLMAIAMRTGFPLAWLETGEAPHDGGTSPDGGLLPGLDSNQEPAGFKPLVSLTALRQAA